MGCNYLSIPKLQQCNCWSLEMDKLFHPTLYWTSDYLSMLELLTALQYTVNMIFVVPSIAEADYSSGKTRSITTGLLMKERNAIKVNYQRVLLRVIPLRMYTNIRWFLSKIATWVKTCGKHPESNITNCEGEFQTIRYGTIKTGIH